MAQGDYISSTELGQLSALPAEIVARIDAATLAANISAASRFVDSFCATRFPGLPFTAWDLDVKLATANVCAFWLASRFGYDPQRGNDSDFRVRYEDALKWLRGVADGSIVPRATVAVADLFVGVVSEDPREL